jgi:thiol peroxidase
MSERTGVITFKGGPLTLVGNEISVGQDAPSFTASANDLSAKGLGDYAGKVVVLVSVPSLDTPVCDTEVRRFNEEATKLGDGVAVVTVSMDLPFAQARWCGAAGIEAVDTLSDYKDKSFGEAYGLMIKELGLLTRAVVVVGKDGKVAYQEIVAEVTHEPDYDKALEAIAAAAG